MGDAKVDQGSLEDAIREVLKPYLNDAPGTTKNPRTEFYSKFKREADEYDGDFLKKYGGDLDTTLLFAALFSAVASAFIVDVRTQLSTDYIQLNYKVAAVMAKFNVGNITASQANDQLPTIPSPDPALARVQAILFSSLAISLLAALVAMLGKQWLARYTQVDMRGSLVQRGRDRHRKIHGMVTWHFDWFMESLPVMLQLALLLLGAGLSLYLNTIDNLDTWVIGGFTMFGFVLFLIFVGAGTLSYDCPFQTPFSIFIRFIICSYNKWRHHRGRKQQPPQPNPQVLANGNNTGDNFELNMENVDPFKLFGKENDFEGFVSDSRCIEWMSKRSMDEEVILDIAAFIPELTWHNGIRTPPLQTLYSEVDECFEKSSGSPVVTSKFKKKAGINAKALLHVAIQRKCIHDNISDKDVFDNISAHHQLLGSQHYDADPELESTLGIIDRVFNNGKLKPGRIRWEKFEFTDSHRAWMGRILFHRACYTLNEGEDLPDDVKGFVTHSLGKIPLPHSQAVLYCLFIVGLVLKIAPRINDEQVTDKRPEIESQVNKIYEKLNRTFRNADPPAEDIKRASEAMGLIAPLSDKAFAVKSYELFHTIMKAPTSLTDPEKLRVARLALHSAYRSEEFMPDDAGDPQDVLTFLDHHFELPTKKAGPIEDALRALAYTSNWGAIEGSKNFDPTKESFVRGIRSAFGEHQPPQLRRAALFFLPLVGDKIFSTTNTATEDMKSLCTGWAFAVEENNPAAVGNVQVRRAALTALFYMIDSVHWRPYIAEKSWKLLNYFTSVPESTPPLKRCIDNPELLTAISNPDGIYIWSTILWLRYKGLNAKVQKQLETVTRVDQRKHIDTYMKTLESEMSKAEQELTKYTTWSTDPRAVALREKTESIREAKDVLTSLKRSPGY